ncbi:LAETG motif-containing sortase-dependent surface protein [Streptomyces sp. NPDC053707]|uniref:LAETG motif-containing sortase-dependent surface protein n=1 Tax=Streptomyces sp. NPDC053707 TaxID=3365712 RepID=UPI0037D0BB39
MKVSLDGEKLTAAPSAGKTADANPAPAPEHTGSDTDAGDGAADATEVRSGGSAPAEDTTDLAATGGGSNTVPLAATGTLLVAAGAGALVMMRRRRRA